MKKWLLERFLPMWAKQTLLSDYKAVTAKNRMLIAQNRELLAYIRGLENGLRAQRQRVKKREAVNGDL